MPSIVAVPYPDRGHVLLEVNFADVPGATHVCVEAVTGAGTDAEQRRQLHAYVSYNSAGCLALSCGQAILWDTEIACDVPTQYCATVTDSSGTVITTAAAAVVLDPFNRVVANGLGVAPTGQTWSVTGGAVADYSVTGDRAQFAVTSTNVNRVGSIPVPLPNYVSQLDLRPTVVALTSPFEQQIWNRGDAGALNGYRARVRYQTTGVIDLILERVTAGVGALIAFSNGVMPYNAATAVSVKLQTWGNQISAKVWDATTAEPPAYQVTGLDATYPHAGTFNMVGRREVGNTNGTINMQFDNLLINDVCAEPVPIEICTEDVTVACDGCFRLGDPVRPCNDIRICLCADGSECGGTGGLFFGGMTADVYADNSGNMLPVNGIYPIHVTRNRRSATGSFEVIPTSFADRDALLALLAPGSTLLWRGPAEYGTGNRYLNIGEVPVAPGLSDLRFQPRLVSLPFVVDKAPPGPSEGVCGARVKDLCEEYQTWDELIAAGITYADLLRGDAGGVPSGLATWASINAEFASWNALQAGETNWSDVLDGD